MSSPSDLKANGARLIRLIVDVGTETMRQHFDSIHPPANLPAVLNANRATLNNLHTRRIITVPHMKLLFPPAGMPRTTSKDYDITLLSILFRNICGLSPPATTHGGTYWDQNPPLSDDFPEAHLARIKFYRNTVFAHIKSTGVSDDDFVIYWSEISRSLVRLGGNATEITKLMTSSLNEDYYLNLIKTQKGIVTINVVALLLSAVIFASLAIFFPGFFQKEPDYSYHQNVSISGFVGREWVFRQMEEEILNARGVLLIAEPGWGKSTIMKRLISSSSSSPIIHENIIGHHICKFDDKSTRDGGRFVKNLVQLIAKKVPEYREIVNKNQLVQDILKSNCNDNPVECFQTAIVEPLHNLDSAERNKSFILVDALDECLEKEESHQSVIVNILYKKVPDLPNWVKLIVTSRNQPMTTSKILKNVRLSNLTIGVDNKRNEEDLHLYANRTLRNFINETSPSGEIIRIQHLINRALYISKGNFLFLKTIIKNWQKYPDKMNAQSIPENLGDLYATFFTERFEKKHLERFEPFLEILLATSSPLTLFQLEKILEHHFGQNYNTREVANSLSEYFKADVDKSQKPLEFHHQFFSEWLVKQTGGLNGIYIHKSRGHHYIADYLLTFYDKRKTNLTFQELSELCAHFLHGKQASNLKRLGSLKVSEIRNYRNKSLLHDLASKRDAIELLVEFIKQFNSVDILDCRKWTPAMYAVEAGNYENVKWFIDNRANLNYIVEREFCSLWYFTRLNVYMTADTLISIAAYRGHFDIVELLVQRGANIEIKNVCGWKPLNFAAMIGNFKIAELFINKGAQPDVLSLHHAAARNHTEIVRLFLNTGLRDECLPCKSEDESRCTTNINNFHLCMCETALYAAVSRNNLEMAKLILQYGNTSVNCRHGSGRTALVEAFSQKNIQMVELLINAGADINAECKSPLTQLMYNCFDKYNPLYTHYCKQPVCDGYRVIDFSFAYGLWKVMTPFISKGKLNISSDNASNLATVAVIYDQVDFINATYGYTLESIPNIETVLRYAVVCHSVKTLEHLLYSEDVSKFTTVYEDGKTLLHFAILGSLKSQTNVYKTQSCPSSCCICPKITHDVFVTEKHQLKTVMMLIDVLTSDINKQDKYGRTALHYATVQVALKFVKYLINAGADWSVTDQRGDTALEYALRETPHVYVDMEIFFPCEWTGDRVFEVCQSDMFDELVSYLLRNQTITECDGRAKTLINGLLYHRLSFSLYSLFKSGLDVNCAREHFIGYLNQTVFNGWITQRDDLLEVFKIFQIDVQVVCGIPFRQSELHLMAYYLRNSSFQVGNLSKLTESKGVEILNECYDKEGYLPIHRAVQGGNIFAFSWFVEIGVDITRKTTSGLTIFVIAIRKSLDDYNKISKFRENYILKQILKISEENALLQCNSPISPLHVMAAKLSITEELLLFMILNSKQSLTCTNSDGIQPIYLFHLYYSYTWFSKEALLKLSPTKYPEREAEYHLIYNMFYHTPQDDLKNVLNDDLFECPAINDLLPNKTEIQEHLKACSMRCWPSAFEASRKFSSNFPYLDIQNNISNADKFMDIASHMAELRFHLVKTFPFFSMSLEKNLWRKIANAHSCAFRCSCFEIMKLLQEKFTSHPLLWSEFERIFNDYASSFLLERMGWTNTSWFGDVRYRWPFRFLLKKALKKYKAYNYLQILNPYTKFVP